MTKVFISTPMKNRTCEQIAAYRAKQKAIVEAIVGESVEVIDSVIADAEPQGDKRIWYLGAALQLMAQADVVVVPCKDIRNEFTGCQIEYEVAREYHKQVVEMPRIPEDCDILQGLYPQFWRNIEM